MTKFTWLRLQNFFAHIDTTLHLNGAGLTLLKGRVIGRAMSNSNGAGKSSLLPDGLLYALFGKTLRGYSGSDVVNLTTKKNCLVTLAGYLPDGRAFEIKRPQSHTKITKLQVTIDKETYVGADICTDIISNTILGGLTYDTCVASLVYGYGNTKFFTSLGDTDRKAILEDILCLSQLTTFQKKANDLHTKALEELSEKSKECIACAAAVDVWASTLSGLEKVLQEGTEQSDKELQNLIEESGYVSLDIAKNKTRQKTLVKEYDQLTTKFKDESRHLVNLRVNLDDANFIAGGLENEVHQIEYSIAHNQQNTVCSHCEQEIPFNRREALINKKVIDKDCIQKQLLAYIRIRDELKEAIVKSTVTVDDLKAKSAHLYNEISNNKTALKQLEANLQTILKSIESIETRLALDTSMLETMKSQAREEEKKLKPLEAEISQLQTKVEMLDFWRKAFGNKGIKSRLIDQAMPQLNQSAEYYSKILTDGEIEVLFSNQTELKSGDMAEKVDVQVRIRDASGSYKGCSGGERRRADIICTLALGDLAKNRLGQAFNIVVLDEIFDGLDDTGIERAMDLLNVLAKDRDSVFVITHSDKMGANFPQALTVEWKDGMSSLI
jgi:DNA repair exonuclease SbcCD ATPase subunit